MATATLRPPPCLGARWLGAPAFGLPAAIFLGRAARPPPEGTREMRVVRVTEIERDIEDLGVGLLQQGGRGRKPCPTDQHLVGDPRSSQVALQGPNAHAEQLGGQVDVRIAFPRQRLDHLDDRLDEIRGRVPTPSTDRGSRPGSRGPVSAEAARRTARVEESWPLPAARMRCAQRTRARRHEAEIADISGRLMRAMPSIFGRAIARSSAEESTPRRWVTADE